MLSRLLGYYLGLSMDIGDCHCDGRVVPALQRGYSNQRALIYLLRVPRG